MLDRELACRIDAHAALAWPATVQERTDSGWLLRATPGVDRGRSNNALPPCRELAPSELPLALQHVTEFARRHSIRAGVQVSPLPLHSNLQRELDLRGWRTEWPVLVLAGPAAREQPHATGGGETRALELTDHASEEWLAAWARCESRRDVAAHAATVLALLRGKALFARLGDRAVAISVESGALVGLFSLAVAPEHRRAGLGTALVSALLARTKASAAYLQVEQRNVAAIAMYSRLGFAEACGYCHRIERG